MYVDFDFISMCVLYIYMTDPQKPVRESITKKLGGTEKSSSSGGVDMSDREKRAAYFAQRFGK